MPQNEPTEQKAQAPARPITESVIAKVAEVMARPEINGNIADAARVLQQEDPDGGFDYHRVRRAVEKSKFLASQHPSTEGVAPDDIETINRTPLLTPEEKREVKAVIQQEKFLKTSDWEALGISKERGEKLVSLERFARMPLQHMVAVTQGGMMKAFADLMNLYEKYAEKLDNGELPQEFDKDGDSKDTQRDWLYAIIATAAEIRNLKSQVDRSVILGLKAAQMMKQTQEQDLKPKRQQLKTVKAIAVDAKAAKP